MVVLVSSRTPAPTYQISDINPNVIHITVAKHRRLRRAGGEGYVVHYEDLGPGQVGWWQEIPTVTVATAIDQCIAYGTPTYLLRQAIDNGHTRGYLRTDERDHLARALEARRER